jgi:hypothetical protein
MSHMCDPCLQPHSPGVGLVALCACSWRALGTALCRTSASAVSSTYDIAWREAIMDLLDQLEAENPEDSALTPKEFSEWACIYVRYLQVFRKLEAAYDQMVHPQKLVDMKKALEACIGRMLEIRHWLVKLNKGMDFLHIDDILVDLKLTPEELEVPVPKFFKLDHQRVRRCSRCSTIAAGKQPSVIRHELLAGFGNQGHIFGAAHKKLQPQAHRQACKDGFWSCTAVGGGSVGHSEKRMWQAGSGSRPGEADQQEAAATSRSPEPYWSCTHE